MVKKKRDSKRELTPEQKRKKFVTYRDNFVKSKLRQMTLRWPPRSEALKLARKERGKYECAHCNKLFHSSQVQLDHAQPIVPLPGIPHTNEGGIDMNVWISRAFIPVEDWLVLCEKCHEAKTDLEDQMRMHYKEKDKK